MTTQRWALGGDLSGSLAHLEENVAAGTLKLSAEDLADLDST